MAEFLWTVAVAGVAFAAGYILSVLMRPDGNAPRPTRDGWHRSADPHLTCCAHCPDGCSWDDQHPGPCRQCIREMETTRPLPGCVTGSDGRCVTCDELHGVHISHRRQP